MDLTPYKINICPEAAIGRRVSKGYFIGPRSNRIEFWDHPVSHASFHVKKLRLLLLFKFFASSNAVGKNGLVERDHSRNSRYFTLIGFGKLAKCHLRILFDAEASTRLACINVLI